METQAKGVFGPNLDFWLLGGGSLLIWSLLAALHVSGLASFKYIQGSLLKIFLFVAFMDLFVNLPHFFISYRLAYFQGRRFLYKNQIQLIWVPLVLASLLLFSTLLALGWAPVRDFERPIRISLEVFGVSGMNAGFLILAMLFVVQYTAVGWHYSKQAFGVTLYRLNAVGQPLAPREAAWLKLSLMCVWLSYFTMIACGDRIYNFGSLTYRSLGWSPVLHTVSLALIPFCLAGNFLLLRRAARRNNQPTDLAACGSVFSVYCWFTPPLYLRVPGFFEALSPFFHSLQYLAFTFRYEINRRRECGKWLGPLLVLTVYGSTIAAGVLLYRSVPTQLDLRFPVGLTGFFGLQAYIFLNLHHYWIDNAIWRRSNPEIRGRLAA